MLLLVAASVNDNGTQGKIKLAEIDDAKLRGNEFIGKHTAKTSIFDVPIAIGAINGGHKVVGLKVENGCLKGSNGVLTRYASVNCKEGRSPLVIVARNAVNGNNHSFCVADANGNVTNMEEDVALRYATKYGIANGKIVEQDGKQFISSIDGEYAVINIVKETKVENNNQAVSNANTVVSQVEPKIVSSEPVAPVVKTPVVNAAPVVPAVAAPVEEKNTPEIRKIQLTTDVSDNEEEYKGTIVFEDGMMPRIQPILGNGWLDGNKLRDEKTGITVEEKLARAMMNIHGMNLFVYSILMSLNRMPCRDGNPTHTAAVSPFTLTLYYSCEYINKLTVAETVFLLIHESYHIMMRHGLRQGVRDHKIWNMAGDYYINKLIVEQFNIVRSPFDKNLIDANCEFVSNKGWKIPSNELAKYITMNPNWLLNINTDTEKESVETIYDEMMRDDEKQQQQQQQQQGDSEGDKNDQGNDNSQQNSGSGQQNQQEESQEKQPSQQYSSGNNQQNQDEQNQQGQQGQQNQQGQDEQNQQGQDEQNQQGQDEQNQQGQQNQQGSSGQQSQQGDNEEQGQDSSNGNDNSDADDSDTVNRGSSSSSNNNNKSKSNSSGNGDNSDKSDGDNKSGEDNKQQKSEPDSEYTKKAEGKDTTPDIVNDTGSPEPTGEDYKNANENIKLVATRAANAERIAGNEIDEFARRMVDEILLPKVDFRALLKKVFNFRVEYNATWKRPGKRGDLAPGIISPGRIKNTENGITNAIFAIDDSGSASDEELRYALGYLLALCLQVNVDIEVIFWNTRVDSMYHVTDRKDVIKIQMTGSGGTDVACVFKYAAGEEPFEGKKRKEKPDVLIIATDGEFNPNYAKYKKVAKDVIWIMYDDVCYRKFKPLFGVKAPIKVDK